MKTIIRQIYYLLALLFSKIVLLLPYGFAVRLGGGLGFLAYYLLSDSRKITENNLKQSFPDKDLFAIKKIAQKCFVNQGKNLFELFSFPKLNNNRFAKIVTFDNKTSMNDALNKGKGILIASAHCGNWEIMGGALSLNGFPINVIARRIYIENLNKLLVGFRNSKGVRVILRSDKSSAKEILRSLRHNEAIGMLIDQDTNVPGVFVDFFSRSAWTPSGLATLALKTGASVVLALDVRLPDDKHKILIRGPLELIRSGDINSDVHKNTQMITHLIEEHIRNYPDQWVWMHRRWKTVQ